MAESRLIVAAARLPIRLARGKGRWNLDPAPGGLATALRGAATGRPCVWIGWPGGHVEPEDRGAVDGLAWERCRARPVHVEPDIFRGYYERFSNRVLWPLFHSIPAPQHFEPNVWEDFQTVNRRFAETIAREALPGDLIWVHDYQLALVPRLLRDRDLGCGIGFFLHIPFPTEDIYRELPVRESLLRGLLGADLIGFHTHEYASYFTRACRRVLGLETDQELIRMRDHSARVAVVPIGIEPDELDEFAGADEVVGQLRRLQERYRGLKVVLGVDRLDYTKGLPEKLMAFEELLRQHPELAGKVVLIQVAAPSRTAVTEYRDLKRQLDELVGRINGVHGTLDWTPVLYINRSLSRRQLVALYRLADVALVTPVRDGMNLVCLEYVAARGERPGDLVLSEFAGAAAWVSGARLINPHHPRRVAEVLAEALLRGPDREGFERMSRFVRDNTSTVWARRFVNRLETAFGETTGRIRLLNLGEGEQRERLARARRRLFLLDYDGTLVTHTPSPAGAAPPDEVRTLLRDLTVLGSVYVVSGRAASTLDEWLGDLPVGLVCEHGLAIKRPGGHWEPLVHVDEQVLRQTVAPLFEDFAHKTPGAYVERKSASLAWHYRQADERLGEERARELLGVLENRLLGQGLSVLAGSKVIEARHLEMSKGNVAARLLVDHRDADLVFCAGNDSTDEEMFEVVLKEREREVLICHVGGINTIAPYVIPTTRDFVDQLRLFADSGNLIHTPPP